eukprot:6181682-Alexandrium_andersonii.AAC.1
MKLTRALWASGSPPLTFHVRAPNATRAAQVMVAATDPIAHVNTRAAEQLSTDPSDAVLLAPNGQSIPLGGMAADVAATVPQMTLCIARRPLQA